MNHFRIPSGLGWYTDPTTNTRQRGQFLHEPIDAYYHSDYHGGDRLRRVTFGTAENIITTLKNQFQDKGSEVLKLTGEALVQILKDDLPQILRATGKASFLVCVVPRSKAESSYSSHQLLFKQSVRNAVGQLEGFEDGADHIIRHTNTRTTHLAKAGYGGDGDLPFPGITRKTCTISENVRGKDILLIDDLYTETVNIDEDALQALLDCGANSVVFYSLGKTVPKPLKPLNSDQHEVL